MLSTEMAKEKRNVNSMKEKSRSTGNWSMKNTVPEHISNQFVTLGWLKSAVRETYDDERIRVEKYLHAPSKPKPL